MKQSKLLAVTMAAVLSLTLAGCSSSKPAENNSNTPTVKAMSGEDLNKIEKDDKEKEKHLVIDVRAENEYKEGHVKHAINIPFAKGVKEYKDYELVKFTTLLADQFQAAIDKKEGTFIDVREAKDFEKGHVAGAKNIDVKNIDKDLAALLPADKNAPVYTYCYSGNRSAKAAQKAVELGYTNVYNAWDGAKEHEYKF